MLALTPKLTEAQKTLVTNYAEGLAHWRAREFARAAAAFARSAEADRPAAFFRDRARELAAVEPGADWDPVRTLQEK